jgi:hypothetical protein
MSAPRLAKLNFMVDPRFIDERAGYLFAVAKVPHNITASRRVIRNDGELVHFASVSELARPHFKLFFVTIKNDGSVDVVQDDCIIP